MPLRLSALVKHMLNINLIDNGNVNVFSARDASQNKNVSSAWDKLLYAYILLL